MGKTIPTYLIDSDLEGTQYAFISNQMSKCFNSAFGLQQKGKTIFAEAKQFVEHMIIG